MSRTRSLGLPYADVTIAALLVVLGAAVAAYPWLGDRFLYGSLAVAALVVIGGLGAASIHRPRDVVSGQIPWT